MWSGRSRLGVRRRAAGRRCRVVLVRRGQRRGELRCGSDGAVILHELGVLVADEGRAAHRVRRQFPGSRGGLLPVVQRRLPHAAPRDERMERQVAACRLAVIGEKLHARVLRGQPDAAHGDIPQRRTFPRTRHDLAVQQHAGLHQGEGSGAVHAGEQDHFHHQQQPRNVKRRRRLAQDRTRLPVPRVGSRNGLVDIIDAVRPYEQWRPVERHGHLLLPVHGSDELLRDA